MVLILQVGRVGNTEFHSELELDRVWNSSGLSFVASLGSSLSFLGFKILKFFEFEFFGFKKIGPKLV